ncbi:MAG: hypothetical protein Q9208_004750 [Pyrenodesmia sp. 3 TL-2023]
MAPIIINGHKFDPLTTPELKTDSEPTTPHVLVQQIGPFLIVFAYLPTFKIQPELMKDGPAAGASFVAISLHKDVTKNDLKDVVKVFRDELNINRIESAFDGLIEVYVDGVEQLKAISEMESVQTIEQVTDVDINVDRATNIVRVSDIRLDRELLGLSELDGSGQFITVTDTGIDLNHPALKMAMDSDYARRHPVDDSEGHGSHVAGIIACSLQDAGEQAPSCAKGIAPGAKLIAKAAFAESNDQGIVRKILNGGVTRLLTSQYDSGKVQSRPRINNNSWGGKARSSNDSSPQPAYSAVREEQVDKALYKRSDLLVVFAAGNDGEAEVKGVRKNQIGSYAAAKNVLTVGASMTDRPLSFLEGEGDIYDVNGLPGNPDSVASFSSRGPTSAGRRKPDVVAPGVQILSTWSTSKQAHTETEVKLNPKHNPWVLASGTSMAAAVVSGCAALLREALLLDGRFFKQDKEITSALLRALLVNGARDISRGKRGPNNEQGHGLIDMVASLRHLQLDTGEDAHFGIGVLSETPSRDSTGERHSKLNITLCYIDQEGPQVQNRLSVIVFAHHPTGGSTKFDTKSKPLNNTQRITIKNVDSYDRINLVLNPELIIAPIHWALAWDFY